MKVALYLAGTAVFAGAVFYGGAVWGVKAGAFQSALAENKLAILNLDSTPRMDPQFREYLKARVYSNVLQFYPSDPGYLLQKDWDRGPVNRDILGNLHTAKGGPDAEAWDWQSAVSAKMRR